MTGLPEIRPGDPTPEGQHVVVYPDGTRREVYGGPAMRPVRSRWRRRGPLLAPAAILVAAAVWPVSRGDQAGEVLLAAGTAGVIWWRGR